MPLLLVTKKLQLFPGLGLYSGIFAIYYLQSSSNRSRTPNIVFYVLCLLYLLSTASFVCDLLIFTLVVSNNILSVRISFLSSVVQWRTGTNTLSTVTRIQQFQLVQITVNACCDFTSQCIIVRIDHCIYHPFYSPKYSKIYRCWIVWGQNIRFVIIPSFLAITCLG